MANPDRFTATEESQMNQGSQSEWELEIEELMTQMEHTLGGKYFEMSPDGKRYVEKHNKELQLINDIGIRYLKAKIQIVANKWSALSVAKEEDVKKFTLFYADEIRMELRAKRKEFGIKRHNFGSLVLGIAQFIFLAQSKSISGGERQYRRGIERRIVSWGNQAKQGVSNAVSGLLGSGK